MADLAPPVLFALALWWASTGAIMWMVRRPAKRLRAVLIGSGLLAALAGVGLVAAAADPGERGAYLGFASALAVWGWHEVAFLTGAVTGPRAAAPLPATAGAWARFRAAASALIHHELALALTAAVVVAVTWSGANPTGALTFLLLFALRLSSKLNLFLGVANPPAALLPPALAHLERHFGKRRFNPLFPVSLAATALVATLLLRAAIDPAASAGEATGYALLFALGALGLLEHAFLMTPSPDRALWGWALRPAPAPGPVLKP